MANEDFRSAANAFAHIVVLAIVMYVVGTILRSSSADGGFDLASRTSMLFFPFQITDPPMEPRIAWLLTTLHWLAVAVLIGGMIRPIPRLRMALATLLAMLVTGVVIELALDLYGYAPDRTLLTF